ncbi:MAG: HEPN domain-containing protein [Promethearchaeota archaeon]
MNRFRDWLNQAIEDYQAAVDSMKSGHFEWTCFQAQQAAEKALKALLLSLNVEAWGHGLIYLLKKWKNIVIDETGSKQAFDEAMYNELHEKSQELDRHYIQPRYPNGFASGYPAEFYNKKTAKECIDNAKSIIEFVKRKIEELSASD